MTDREHEIYDVVGIGFGPSNLSLAIALEERGSAAGLSSHFFERQPRFGWHRNMLLPAATMQISFLKDLVTFRNPTSSFSFVSFLHASGRLAQFVNNKDFFPTRQEFHQYLEWAQARVAGRVSYGSRVTSIRPVPDAVPGSPELLRLTVSDEAGGAGGAGRVVDARNVVISTGLVPRMLDGVPSDERVWHSSEFLTKFHRMDPAGLRRVAVVGAGQSAAEITRFLYDRLPHAEVSAIIPSYGYSVADDTPFANQIFDPGAVDDYYYGTEQTREAFWRYHRNTNYSVVDDEVIRGLYRRAYEDQVQGMERLRFLNLTRVDGVKRAGTETRVSLRSGPGGEAGDLDVDALVCATGYHSMEPTGLLGELDQHCLRDERGRLRMTRDYRIVTTPELSSGLYLQGGTEHTHGLSSSLLSNLAVRSGEIVDSIVDRCTGPDATRSMFAMAGGTVR